MLHSDRATLAVIIRLSSFTRDLGIAVLYPGKLVDPLRPRYTETTAPPGTTSLLKTASDKLSYLQQQTGQKTSTIIHVAPYIPEGSWREYGDKGVIIPIPGISAPATGPDPNSTFNTSSTLPPYSLPLASSSTFLTAPSSTSTISSKLSLRIILHSPLPVTSLYSSEAAISSQVSSTARQVTPSEPWESIELVLLPAPRDDFIVTVRDFDELDTPHSKYTERWESKPLLDYNSRALPLAMPAFALQPPSVYTLVGLEGLPGAGGDDGWAKGHDASLLEYIGFVRRWEVNPDLEVRLFEYSFGLSLSTIHYPFSRYYPTHPMFDIRGYPHILREITQHLDRPALSTMIRLSSFTHAITEPFLYPKRLIDPFLLPDPTIPQLNLSAERAYRKLESFCSSRSLQQVEEIVITHPEIWAEYLRLAGRMPPSAVRASGRVTTIIVKPVGLGLDEAARRNSHRQTIQGHIAKYSDWFMPEAHKIMQERASDTSRGLRIQAELSELSDRYFPGDPTFIPSSGFPETWPRAYGAHQYHHIFSISVLLHSSRLILQLPTAAHIDVINLCNAVCVEFAPPTGATWLTLLVGSGNVVTLYYIQHGRRKAQSSWQRVEVILLPNSIGIHPYLRRFDDLPPDVTPNVFSLGSARASLRMMHYPFGIAACRLPSTARCIIVGTENIDLAKDGEEKHGLDVAGFVR
ncbi:uncharacterized protein MKK02DRAFT_28090 [Dioszegia hungarica]|uniref:Uncharacterized protein n=1 Tax=Dioszegia hungarica TaxID=4972 RepID=A0AA38H6P5_9TREE|nr:uncharacterized protein MKK02DRAFT_28090 [Dioszegia hungarica]KAI9634985.1 hypothetical protein MKK02DRAFT_28090 [Dioszegia hungarica]